ncbi:MAG: glycine--tRNA ligase [Patescibacteria group bacterium]
MKKEKNNGVELMDKIVSLCKRRGFIFPGSEIYGGMANSWDYGPLGVELKNNIKQAWWKKFVHSRTDMVGIDAALIMNPKVWEASGHLKNFTDPLVECKKCHERFRADKLISDNQKVVLLQKELSDFIEKYLKDNLGEAEGKANQVEYLTLGFDGEIKDSDYSGREQEKIIKYFKKAAQQAFDLIHYDVDVNEEGHYEGGWDFREAFLRRFSPVDIKDLAEELYLDREIKCPACDGRDWGATRQFNLMFKTFIGPAEESANVAYFRPETAQAMFVDFKQVAETSRKRIPFGIAQIGKAFRNEITPGNFIFRTREFEQMEIEYFIREKDWEKTFEYWHEEMYKWMGELGLKKEHLHDLEVPEKERAHYSKRTIDIEYDFPFGTDELYGLAYRTDFDLENHAKASGQSLEYLDPETQEKFIPHVIEPTFGVDRSVLAVLCESYNEEEAPTAEEGKTEPRVVLKFPKWLAPIKVAILPLSKKEELAKVARPIYEDLVKYFICEYDETQSIGKRYRRQDEIGTPYCVTVDFETLEDKSVTVRDRDTMKQERIKIEELVDYLKIKLEE